MGHRASNFTRRSSSRRRGAFGPADPAHQIAQRLLQADGPWVLEPDAAAVARRLEHALAAARSESPPARRRD